jgi:hypothetical protein
VFHVGVNFIDGNEKTQGRKFRCPFLRGKESSDHAPASFSMSTNPAIAEKTAFILEEASIE